MRESRPLQAKHLFFIFYGLITLFVIYRYELRFLDSKSPVWEHFAPVRWWLIPHGVAGAVALVLAPLQFSNRMRQRQLWLHRILGRLYVGCVLISAPVSVYIGFIQGPPGLEMASIVQGGGWIVTTLIALYCIRAGNVAQHRQWMLRSYPFAMVFVFTRAILAIPFIERMGVVGVVSVVWTCIAAACFIPSLIISWRSIFPRRALAQKTLLAESQTAITT